MSGKGTIDAVFIMRRLQEEYLNKEKKLYMCFVDLRCLVSLVGKVPVYRAVGSGSIPGQIFTQGLKIIEEKVLLLL